MDQQQQRRVARRQALDDLKTSAGGCVDCGYNGHPAALHWDHVDGDKACPDRHAIRLNWAWARILAEVAKCELVCANCHAIRTAQRGYARPSTPRRPIVRGEFGITRHRASHCGKGHPFDDANTYVAPNGRRRCRACDRVTDRRRRARR